MGAQERMLMWSLAEVGGLRYGLGDRQRRYAHREGQQSGLMPTAYWVRYRLETSERFVTARLLAESKWDGGNATLDLRHTAGEGWIVDGVARSDLDDAQDLDLAGCPLTNTMPILRHGLHVGQGDHDFLMAFIEVPRLRVVPSRQHYTHLRRLDGGGAIVRYQSGSFESDLTIDSDGFVVDYPQLGHRLEPPVSDPSLRTAGPGSARPS